MDEVEEQRIKQRISILENKTKALEKLILNHLKDHHAHKSDQISFDEMDV